jgi:hypothetical protein
MWEGRDGVSPRCSTTAVCVRVCQCVSGVRMSLFVPVCACAPACVQRKHAKKSAPGAH